MPTRITVNNVTYSTVASGGIELYADSGQSLGGESQPLRITSSTTQAEIGFWLDVTAANEAALKTAIDGIRNNVQSLDMTHPVVVDNGGSGSVIAQFQTGTIYTQRDGAIDVHILSPTFATVWCTVTFRGPDRTAGGGASEDPMVDSGVEAQVGRNTGGYLSMVLRASFKNSSNDSAMTRAQAWVNTIKGRNSAPTNAPWLPGKDVFRVVDDSIEPVQSFDTGLTSNNYANAMVVLYEMDDALKTLDDSLRQVVVGTSAEAMHLPPGITQQWRVTITAQMEWKVAGLTSYDSTDTAPGWPSASAINTALSLILTVAKARGGWTNLNAIKETSNLDVTTGSMTVVLECITGPIISWDETIETSAVNQALVVGTGAPGGGQSGGSARKFLYQDGLPVQTTLHTVTISRLAGPANYTASQLAGEIEDSSLELEFTQGRVIETTLPSIGYAGGITSSPTVFTRTFRRVTQTTGVVRGIRTSVGGIG